MESLMKSKTFGAIAIIVFFLYIVSKFVSAEPTHSYDSRDNLNLNETENMDLFIKTNEEHWENN